jgi:hypothetical protein
MAHEAADPIVGHGPSRRLIAIDLLASTQAYRDGVH